jgi:DNA-directed RNA polymerase subunit RPC12/RpoP
MPRWRSSLRCVECGAEADELAAGWRAYRAGDLDEDDAVKVLYYCPSCSEREFGLHWWDTPDVL